MNMVITVVLAIYHPKLSWLQEELKSIDEQTFCDFEVLIWNDDPKDTYDYASFFGKFLHKHKYEIFQGKMNLGSTGAFEQLTRLVKTPYIAYCDQDDIWMPKKLEILVNYIKNKNTNLVCSDMYVIDEDSHVISDSITKVRPHHIFYKGKNTFEYLLTRNFVTGCTMVIKTSIAKAALPFPSNIVHDWWLALYASYTGEIGIVDLPLMKYRIHKTNQTLILKGITSKKDYYEKRILKYMNFISIISERINSRKYNHIIQTHILWAKIRKIYFQYPSLNNAISLYKLRYINHNTTYFDLLIPWIPQFIFLFIINMIRKGII